MPSIYKYQKHITQTKTVALNMPEGEDGQEGLELATIDGETYVVIPNGLTLPEQPEEISAELVVLTPELRQTICSNSPHIHLIDERVVERIRERYTQNDELKYARLAWSDAKTAEDLAELGEYDAHVESARSWGRDQKALLGLG